MAELSVELSELEHAFGTFKGLHDEFQSAYTKLDCAIKDLRGSDWLSDASTAYFKQYEDTWKKNMNMHIAILEHLRDCLNNAKTEYTHLLSALPGAENQIL